MERSLLSANSLMVLFRRGYLRQTGTQIVAVAVALLFLAVLMLGINVTRQQDSFARDQHTDKILMLIGRMETSIAQTESSIRGYALTGDPMFLGYTAPGARQRRGRDGQDRFADRRQ